MGARIIQLHKEIQGGATVNRDHVNRTNSRTWVKVNEDTKSAFWRKVFVDMHGGEFVKQGKRWHWEEVLEKETPKNCYIFQDGDGILHEVENVAKFCRDNSLNKAALYEVISGKRNHHKNFKFIEKRNDI